MKNALIAAGVIVLLGGGYFAWKMFVSPAAEPAMEQKEVVMSTYATTTFSIRYPSSYTVDDMYAYDQFEGKPIAGVKFTIPESVTAGTNLSFDTGISVEWLPRAKTCTGDIYIVPNVKAISLTVGSTTYSVATSTGVAAGNIYEEMVFAFAESSPCIAVRYLLHSSNIGNYDLSAVREFDRAALLREFDAIRNSLLLNQ